MRRRASTRFRSLGQNGYKPTPAPAGGAFHAVNNGTLDDLPARDKGELQYAHDMLSALVSGQIPSVWNDLDTDERSSVNIALSVLCWALKHDHNANFDDFMAALQDMLHTYGVTYRVRPDAKHSR